MENYHHRAMCCLWLVEWSGLYFHQVLLQGRPIIGSYKQAGLCSYCSSHLMLAKYKVFHLNPLFLLQVSGLIIKLLIFYSWFHKDFRIAI